MNDETVPRVGEIEQALLHKAALLARRPGEELVNQRPPRRHADDGLAERAQPLSEVARR